MDCASCAATVERRVGRLPGMHRAVVNFAAGRLDAEHDRDLALQEIEKAVRDAGYGVGSTQEAEVTPFWRTPRAISVFASALLFALGLALGLAGCARGCASRRLPRGHRGWRRADLPGGHCRATCSAPGHERAHERGHSRGGGNRAVGRGRFGGGTLRRRQRSAGLRNRPHPWGGARASRDSHPTRCSSGAAAPRGL